VPRRLSHCAAVVDGALIIVGGWSVNNQRLNTTLRDCYQIQPIVSSMPTSFCDDLKWHQSGDEVDDSSGTSESDDASDAASEEGMRTFVNWLFCSHISVSIAPLLIYCCLWASIE
jgi:phosphatidylserine/phosphatidylglycerophosphate/cardiolipin synthase-like enzyme